MFVGAVGGDECTRVVAREHDSGAVPERAQERRWGDVDPFGPFREGQPSVGRRGDGRGRDPLVADEIGEQLEGVEVL
jgi:hypothetical protein